MSYRRYSLILCVVVFIILTTVFTAFLCSMVGLKIKAINGGGEDEKILKDYRKRQKKNKNKRKKQSRVIGNVFSIFFCALFSALFVMCVYLGFSQNGVQNTSTLFRVVNSSSMSYKHKRNEYLFSENLNTQFDTYDLIITHALPPEHDLKLYDVVVYEVDGALVIHRIVGIEEPNAKHPNERWFTLQGDAVQNADRFPVLYSQMRAIYYGKRIPFVGSFIAFLQSPAGYLCLLLILVEILIEPFVKKRLKKAISARLAILLRRKENRDDCLNKKQLPPLVVISPQYPMYVRCKDCQPSGCNKPCPYRFAQLPPPVYPLSFRNANRKDKK